ncbi:hypothetical protein ABEB36_004975 [Hypothenemus hampei]|uniref:G-protein coupled receptors family 1 profile domain-containing protein n=1 Tax=Hypothenemus hampei TaxID=57062 RepID=A0ABD1EWI6_HYPHA
MRKQNAMSNYSFTNEFNNETTNLSSSTTGLGSNNDNVFESQLMIPLYLIIFVLSIAGNTLVLFTLMRNKRMKTVTNVYLLNLQV